VKDLDQQYARVRDYVLSTGSTMAVQALLRLEQGMDGLRELERALEARQLEAGYAVDVRDSLVQLVQKDLDDVTWAATYEFVGGCPGGCLPPHHAERVCA
jgi:hypothetical protein